MAESDIVLSWQDSLIRQADFLLLNPPGWLNDKIMGFYFEYLECVTFSDYKSKVCFITPDVGQFIKLCNGPELGVFLEPLSLAEKQLVVVSVNNNPLADKSGGSHWSVFMYNRVTNCFHHYDSLSTTNQTAAKQCAAKLTPFLSCGAHTPRYIEEPCPQQTNGHDCGVYSLIFTEVISRHFLLGSSTQSVTAHDLVTCDMLDKWRSKTKQLILSLTNQ